MVCAKLHNFLALRGREDLAFLGLICYFCYNSVMVEAILPLSKGNQALHKLILKDTKNSISQIFLEIFQSSKCKILRNN